MKCFRCSHKKFLRPLTIQDGVITEHICIYCEVTDVKHSDCRLSEEEIKDSGYPGQRELEDPLNGITFLLPTRGEEIH